MRKFGLLLLPVLMLLAAATASRGQDMTPDAEGRRTITVSGTAEVTAAPDMALVSIGVTEEAKEARDALSAMNAAAAAVLDRLTAEGVEDRDMQTGTLRLDPIYGNDSSGSFQNRIDGYRASTEVTVRVRDLEALGAILDVVVTDGANQLSNLRFDLSEPDPLLEEARRSAVTKARAKAVLYAEAAGVTLGQLVSLSESGFDMPRPVDMMMESRAGGGVPVAAGEVSISASVTLVYLIGGGE